MKKETYIRRRAQLKKDMGSGLLLFLGIHESQVAAAVEEVACRHGHRLAFPTIATVQGQVLHNHGFIHQMKEGDIFLLDAGMETEEQNGVPSTSLRISSAMINLMPGATSQVCAMSLTT